MLETVAFVLDTVVAFVLDKVVAFVLDTVFSSLRLLGCLELLELGVFAASFVVGVCKVLFALGVISASFMAGVVLLPRQRWSAFFTGHGVLIKGSPALSSVHFASA